MRFLMPACIKKFKTELILEADIREAIKSKEFFPFYQPIFQLGSNEIVGFEALARWQSHKRGMVFPNDFIPLAEETRLVIDIDMLILESACQQISQWQQLYPEKNWYVSCNLFAEHFFDSKIVDKISHILRHTGIPAECLRIELTERALLEDNDTVLTHLKALKRIRHYTIIG